MLEANARAAQTATQDVARQTAALDQAQVVLDNHTLRASIAGTVTVSEAELGQLVGPTIALLKLADLNDLAVEADVDEAYATQITAGLPAPTTAISASCRAALTVPHGALLADGTGVFIVNDGKTERRVLSVVEWPDAPG